MNKTTRTEIVGVLNSGKEYSVSKLAELLLSRQDAISEFENRFNTKRNWMIHDKTNGVRYHLKVLEKQGIVKRRTGSCYPTHWSIIRPPKQDRMNDED